MVIYADTRLSTRHEPSSTSVLAEQVSSARTPQCSLSGYRERRSAAVVTSESCVHCGRECSHAGVSLLQCMILRDVQSYAWALGQAADSISYEASCASGGVNMVEFQVNIWPHTIVQLVRLFPIAMLSLLHAASATPPLLVCHARWQIGFRRQHDVAWQ